jgi:glycosyltransferase involved in cell wall biosynthesis
LGQITVLPLGYDRPPRHAEATEALPEGLEPGHFALLVSTVEPRKGHALLIDAWRRLLADGIPQRHRFKLVFVGRMGWMVDQVRAQLGDKASFDDTLLHLENVSDGALAELYRAAGFCLYPSLYEGFGLPVIEAYSYGKAVIASTGGAIPEIAARFSPCLDPRDHDAWYAEMRRWIEVPAERAAYEARVSAFTHPTWDEASARIFAAARAI